MKFLLLSALLLSVLPMAMAVAGVKGDDTRRLAGRDFSVMYTTSCDGAVDGEDQARPNCAVGKDEWLAVRGRCNDVSYEMRTHVDDHVFVLAIPHESSNRDDEEHPSCPTLAFDDGGVAGKVVSVFHYGDYDDQDEQLAGLRSSSFHHADDLKLADIATAFDKAETMTSLSNDEGDYGYSLINNNCATFMLSMHDALQFSRPSTEFVDYVVDSLLAHGVGNKILESPDVDELHATDAEKTNVSALTRLLVETYIVNFMDEVDVAGGN